jgi:hypothetical protein
VIGLKLVNTQGILDNTQGILDTQAQCQNSQLFVGGSATGGSMVMRKFV